MINEEFENLLQQEKEKAYQKGSQDKMLDVMVLMIEDSCFTPVANIFKFKKI